VRAVGIFVSIAASLSAIYGQPAYPSISADDLTTFSLYGQLFQHVVSFQKIADDLRARGADDRAARHQLRFAAGLTDAEEAAVIRASKECEDVVMANSRRANDLLIQLQTKRAAGTPYPSALEQELMSLLNKNIAAVFGALSKVQAALGAARFLKLDHYVRTSIADEMKRGGVSLTPPPPWRQPATQSR
jgi:hypothetical protein